jgi:hypothetical protein
VQPSCERRAFSVERPAQHHVVFEIAQFAAGGIRRRRSTGAASPRRHSSDARDRSRASSSRIKRRARSTFEPRAVIRRPSLQSAAAIVRRSLLPQRSTAPQPSGS